MQKAYGACLAGYEHLLAENGIIDFKLALKITIWQNKALRLKVKLGRKLWGRSERRLKPLTWRR